MANLPANITIQLWGIGGIFDDIDAELKRAIEKHTFEKTPMSPGLPLVKSYAVLAEEFLEATREFIDNDFVPTEDLEKELIQTAAMSVATLVGIRLAKEVT